MKTKAILTQLLLPGLSFLAASLAFSQATPPEGFVKMPDSIHCSMRNVMQAGGASTGGQWALSSVGSVSCSTNGKSEQDVPLASGDVKNGMLATKSFGDFYIAGGGFSFQMYIRSEQLQPFAQFLDTAPPALAKTAGDNTPKLGDVFQVTNKKDLKFLHRAEGAKLSNTRLPSGKLVPAAPEGTIWRVRNGKIVLEEYN